VRAGGARRRRCRSLLTSPEAEIRETYETDVQKSDPAVIVNRILDALEAGQDEAIADDVSRQVKAGLSALTTGILPGSSPADLAAE
jgi:hypothetical protein